MSDDGDGEDEVGPPSNVIFFAPGQKRPPKRATNEPPKTEKRVVHVGIPTLPQGEINMAELARNATNPSKRAYAAYIMRKRSIPYQEIAELLEYPSAEHARGAVAGFIASVEGKPETVEVMRQTLIGTMEDSLRRSITFAGADYFEDADGNRYPNENRLAWHKELRQDVEVLARISGAQAAAQLRLLSPESEELDAIVLEIERAQGRVPVEADDVLVLDVIEIGDEASG
jgi:hypothetical protein